MKRKSDMIEAQLRQMDTILDARAIILALAVEQTLNRHEIASHARAYIADVRTADRLGRAWNHAKDFEERQA